MSKTSDMRRALLSPIRRGRPVAWTPNFMGFGNVLHVVMWAWLQERAGNRSFVLATPAIEPWMDTFPGMRRYVLERHEVKFTDRRRFPWRETKELREVDPEAGYDSFDDADFLNFVNEVVIPGSPMSEPGFVDVDPDLLVINVRRGDHYSVPAIRGEYGFDVDAYLKEAMRELVATQGSPSQILVVSDGPQWCRARLGWLADYAPVNYPPEDAGAVANLMALARANRIVMTNSTFSYWGAHLSNALRGNNHSLCWAPDFFDRTRNGGRAFLLDPRWSVVRDIPGGWDS